MSLVLSVIQTLDLRSFHVSFLNTDDDDKLRGACDDFRMSAAKILKQIIEDKKRANPRLSLRSIAAKMEISSGRLSEILNEKRPLSAHYLEKICHVLKLSSQDAAQLRRAFLRGDGAAEGESNVQSVLGEQEMTTLADWKPYALMSFFQTATYKKICQSHPGKEAQFAKIAQALAVSTEEIKQLLNTLSGAHLVKWTQTQWSPAVRSTRATYDIPDEILREGLVKDLDLAKEKLQELDAFAREFSTMTLVMDHKDLTKAKKLLRTFLRNFTKSLERGQKKEVYQLSLQFFPLTKVSEDV